VVKQRFGRFIQVCFIKIPPKSTLKNPSGMNGVRSKQAGKRGRGHWCLLNNEGYDCIGEAG